jgi:hypothetical protein
MNLQRIVSGLPRVLAIASVLSLSACGGGGGGGDIPVASPTAGIIGGTGFKGPVAGATVTAYAIGNGAMGTKIGNATTDASGNFSVSIGNYSGPVMLQLSGGTYTDEATGSTMPMASGDVMATVLPTVAANATTTGVMVTPLTSMAQTMAQQLAGGMSEANIATANAAVGSYFMVSDILHVTPTNPLVAGAGAAARQDSINYGMSLAAMSQYAKTLGMSTSSAMITALTNDASDGVMNGMTGSGSVMMGGMGMGGARMPANAGTSDLANAMSAFVASSQNRSGVTAPMMQSLIGKLSASNGQLGGSTATPPMKSSISGTVFNGTMQQATVTAYAVSNGAQGAQLASAATDAQGNFTMSMGSYSGAVMLQASNGKYVDAATGTVMSMASTDVMAAAMTSIASGSPPWRRRAPRRWRGA